jgi:hypothetical protein
LRSNLVIKKGREAASRDFVALAARGRWLRAVPRRNRMAAAPRWL